MKGLVHYNILTLLTAGTLALYESPTFFPGATYDLREQESDYHSFKLLKNENNPLYDSDIIVS